MGVQAFVYHIPFLISYPERYTLEAMSQTQDKLYGSPRCFRLNYVTKGLLEKVAEKLGLAQADVVRLAIRRMAEIEGVIPKPPGKTGKSIVLPDTAS